MSEIIGHIKKMQSKLTDPVQYSLPIGDDLLPLNPLLGKQLIIRNLNEIHCLYCNRKTNKSFNQGYCFPCFRSLARCDICIIKPELCHFHKGTCRQPDWGHANCMQTHYVYLAQTSNVKVGITRLVNVPTRWIDQGAIQAMPLFKVNTRKEAGFVEVALANIVKDKTNWRKMLQATDEKYDLIKESEIIIAKSEQLLANLQDTTYEKLSPEITVINYPVNQYLEKITAFNLEKTPEVQATLMGIKGQYLIFDTGVLNLRKYGGYLLQINYADQ